MKYCDVTDRGVIRVSGEEARHFLQGLITADMDAVTKETAKFAALLTPQGKILFDFFIVGDGDSYLIETPKAHCADLAKRLTFYKLRAKVGISDLTDTHKVIALWDADAEPAIDGRLYRDPRINGLGYRAIVARDGSTTPADWQRSDSAELLTHRIGFAVPEAGLDYEYGDVFPHDVDMDALNGVDFEKGCYVGQEVVSRMQHRATARRRIVAVRADAALPEAGTAITAGGKAIGSLGSSDRNHGLASIRLDRAKGAIDAGRPFVAGDTEITLTIPDWATFDWPETKTETA